MAAKSSETTSKTVEEDQTITLRTENVVDKSQYIYGYDAVHSWVKHSLDLYKHELFALCFPLYVHSYFSLIRGDNVEEAKKLLELWRNDHADTFWREIIELDSVNSSTDLASPKLPFTHAALTTKFTVKMTNAAFNLLNVFLADNNLMVQMSILNERIAVTFHSGPPSAMFVIAELKGYTLKATSASVMQMELGVPGHPNKNRAKVVASTGKNAPSPMTRTDPLLKEMITKLARPMRARRQQAFDTIEEVGQKRALTESKDSSAAADSGEKEADTSPLRPSVVFVTAANSAEDMTCMEINSDVTQLKHETTGRQTGRQP